MSVGGSRRFHFIPFDEIDRRSDRPVLPARSATIRRRVSFSRDIHGSLCVRTCSSRLDVVDLTRYRFSAFSAKIKV
jgi:hypothetical protein